MATPTLRRPRDRPTWPGVTVDCRKPGRGTTWAFNVRHSNVNTKPGFCGRDARDTVITAQE